MSAMPRRHPAEVTADRLGYAVGQWFELFEPGECDEISHIIHALSEIADGTRRSDEQIRRSRGHVR